MSIKINQRWLRTLAVPVSACLATLLALPVSAVTIPDVPLQTNVPVAPNIMFIMDDSGSMQGEIMPGDYVWDSTVCYDQYGYVSGCRQVYPGSVFPRGRAGVYGDSDYTDATAFPARYYVNNAWTDSTSAYGRLVRSPQINRIYYNPAVTYTPWLKADGTSMGNVSITCAPHNPMTPGTGTAYCRDLTQRNSGNTNGWWVSDRGGYCAAYQACASFPLSLQFWPAEYYWFSGNTTDKAQVWDRTKYTPRIIQSSTTSYVGEGRGNRTDCANRASATCTYAEEIQNFANWYSYYRSRILLTRAGVGTALADLPTVDTPANPVPRVGFGAINTTGTVIKGVSAFVGTSRSDFYASLYDHAIPAKGTPLRNALKNVGEYYVSNNAAWESPSGTGTTMLGCRASFSILMTDGYWNDSTSPGVLNSDNVDGTVYTGIDGKPFGYKARAPFSDGNSDTLADVAMAYWKRDLRPDIDNKVKPRIYEENASWQRMVTFGIGLGVAGVQSPAAAFAAIKTGETIAWGNPGGDADTPAKIDDLLHAAVNSRGDFFSAADPVEFKKGLSNILDAMGDGQASNSAVEISSSILTSDARVFASLFRTPDWAGEVEAYRASLNGLVVPPLWLASQGFPADYTQRKIFTGADSGTGGAVFPTINQTTALTVEVANYIRGDRSNEIRKGGALRLRDRRHPLGDIINSSPHYVQGTDTVYVGANDGMMHAFNGTTGKEVFAFVPRGINLAKLKEYSNPAYGHSYFVDGPVVTHSFPPVGTADPRRLLVGTLGRGGKGLYSLDVSKPSQFGTGDVKWEVTTGNNLGQILGEPIIGKLNDGNWGVIVGNGINSTSGRAVLMIYNLETGALIKEIDTGVGSDNGLSAPRGWDVDADGDVDEVYAGDLKGNLWKFDLSGGANQWKLAFTGGKPLFVARDKDNNPQPITGGVTVATNLTTNPAGATRFVFFGTGSYMTVGDKNNKATQSMYAVQDLDTPRARSDLQLRTIAQYGVDAKGQPIGAFEPPGILDPAKKGWVIDLLKPVNIQEGERVVRTPTIRNTVLEFDSIIPDPDPCATGGRGFINRLDAFTGTATQKGAFDLNGDGDFSNDKLGDTTVGRYDPGGGMPTGGDTINSGDGTGVRYGGGSEGGEPKPTPRMDERPVGRISWRELIRN